MIFLDTNYLIRFLTRDIESQAKEAKQLIDTSPNLYVTSIVLAEAVYILETHYSSPKEKVCTQLLSLLKLPNIISVNFAPLAFEIYRLEKISFYDSLLVSEVIHSKSQIKTFDQKLVRIFSKYQ